MGDEEAPEVKKKGKLSLPLKLITLSFRIPLLLIVALVVISFFATSFFLSKYPNSLRFIGLTLNPQLQAQQDNLKLMVDIGNLMNLPADEQPTVATVTDVDAVENQPFFANAQNGDKVLIYTNAKKAILYRPNEHRIIEVGAVDINQDEQVELTDDENVESDESPDGEVAGEFTEEDKAPASDDESEATPTPETEDTEE